MSRVIVLPKGLAEVRIEVLDFSPFLPVGVTVTSAAAVCTVYSGVDASPGSVIASTTVLTPNVSVKLQGGVLGCIYSVIVSAACSDTQIRNLAFYLAVVPDLV